MKALIAILALAGALPALAEPGFFRPAPLAREERPQEIRTPKDAALPCSLVVSYNTARPSATLIAYLFNDWLQCRDSFPVAIAAAASAAKVSVPGEPANPPVYECSITVAFDSSSAGAPFVTNTATDACTATNKAALTIAAQQVACVFLRSARCPS